MSLAVLAQHMSDKGRYGDDMLVHMSKDEVAALQQLAENNGLTLTINPDTGLPEAFSLKKLLKSIAPIALNFLFPGAGAAIGSALGVSSAVGGALFTGGISALASGSLEKGLMTGLMSYGLSGLGTSAKAAGAAGTTPVQSAAEAAASGATVDPSLAAKFAQAPSLEVPAGFDYASGAPITSSGLPAVSSAVPAGADYVSGAALPDAGTAITPPSAAVPYTPSPAFTPSIENAMDPATGRALITPQEAFDKLSLGEKWEAIKRGDPNFLKNNMRNLAMVGLPALSLMSSEQKLGDVGDMTDPTKVVFPRYRFNPYTGKYEQEKGFTLADYRKGVLEGRNPMRAADGGIVALADGGVARYQGGGVPEGWTQADFASWVERGGDPASLGMAPPPGVSAPPPPPPAPSLEEQAKQYNWSPEYYQTQQDLAAIRGLMNTQGAGYMVTGNASAADGSNTTAYLPGMMQQAGITPTQGILNNYQLITGQEWTPGSTTTGYNPQTGQYTIRDAQGNEKVTDRPVYNGYAVDPYSERGKQLTAAAPLPWSAPTTTTQRPNNDGVGGEGGKPAGAATTPAPAPGGVTTTTQQPGPSNLTPDQQAVRNTVSGFKSQEELNKFFATTGLTPEQLRVIFPEYSVQDIRNAQNAGTNAYVSGFKSQDELNKYFATTKRTPQDLSRSFPGYKLEDITKAQSAGVRSYISGFTSQAQLDDYFRTTPYTATELQRFFPEYSVVDIQKAMDRARGKTTAPAPRPPGAPAPGPGTPGPAPSPGTPAPGPGPVTPPPTPGMPPLPPTPSPGSAMTGASLAAYDYLMGQGAYPTVQQPAGGLAKPYYEVAGIQKPTYARKELAPASEGDGKGFFGRVVNGVKINSDAPSGMQPAYDRYWTENPVGSEIAWAGGKLKRIDEKTAIYTSPDGKQTLMTPDSRFYDLATASPEIAALWKTQFGYVPTAPGSSGSNEPFSGGEGPAAGPDSGNTSAPGTTGQGAVGAATAAAAVGTGEGGDNAKGGIIRRNMGGITALAGGGYNLGDYSDGGRLLRGPGDGVSDSIPATIANKRPARLADGEFVVPARIVSELGNGSTNAGAKKLYAMMDRIQARRGKTVGKGKVAVNSRADKMLPA